MHAATQGTVKKTCVARVNEMGKETHRRTTSVKPSSKRPKRSKCIPSPTRFSIPLKSEHGFDSFSGTFVPSLCCHHWNWLRFPSNSVGRSFSPEPSCKILFVLRELCVSVVKHFFSGLVHSFEERSATALYTDSPDSGRHLQHDAHKQQGRSLEAKTPKIKFDNPG